jgi:hypothetical protein
VDFHLSNAHPVSAPPTLSAGKKAPRFLCNLAVISVTPQRGINLKEKFMPEAQHIQDYKIRLDAAKKLLSELEATILNAEAREQFLHTTKSNLRESEAFIADAKNQNVGIASFALTMAEKNLVWVKKLVDEYGPNIQIGRG